VTAAQPQPAVAGVALLAGGSLGSSSRSSPCLPAVLDSQRCARRRRTPGSSWRPCAAVSPRPCAPGPRLSSVRCRGDAHPGTVEVAIADAAGTVRFASDAALAAGRCAGCPTARWMRRAPGRVSGGGSGERQALYRASPIQREALPSDAGRRRPRSAPSAWLPCWPRREVHTLTRCCSVRRWSAWALSFSTACSSFAPPAHPLAAARALPRCSRAARRRAAAVPAPRARADHLLVRQFAHCGRAAPRARHRGRCERDLVAAQRDERYRSELKEMNSQLNAASPRLDEANERINALAAPARRPEPACPKKAVKNISALNRVGVALSPPPSWTSDPASCSC
jgi:hypothetical protein